MPAKINRQLKRNLRSISTGGRPAAFRARTGNGAGVVEVPGYPYRVWVRPESGGQPLIVYNLRGAPSVQDWPVIVGESDYNPGALQILEADSSRLSHLPEDSSLPPHADSHFLNGLDPIWADTRQIVNLLAVPAGMTVTIYAGLVQINSTPIYVPQTVVDLTSSIPVTGARWAVIRSDNAGTLAAVMGNVLDSYADLQMTNIPSAGGTNYAALWAVKLYSGMTAISNVTASPDLVDMRFMAGTSGGGTGAGSDIGVRVYNDTNISIADATTTALTFNSERWDTDGMHSTSVNPGRLTCTRAGKYVITGNVEFAANATGRRILTIYHNNLTDIASTAYTVNSATLVPRLNVGCEYDLALNDFVELRVYQNSGGALNVLANAARSPEFMMQLISASSTIRYADRFLLMGG